MEELECGQINGKIMQKSVVQFSFGWAQNAEVILSNWVALLGSAALHRGWAGTKYMVYSSPT